MQRAERRLFGEPFWITCRHSTIPKQLLVSYSQQQRHCRPIETISRTVCWGSPVAKDKRNQKKPPIPDKKTPAEQKYEHEERLRQSSELYKTVRYTIVSGMILSGFCFASYSFVRFSEAVAGKQTNFNTAINFLAGLNVSAWAGYALAAIFGSSTYYNWRGRRKAEKAAARAAALEERLDPNRKSSGLNKEGGNPEGDAV